MVAALIRSRLHLFTDGFYYPNICKRALKKNQLVHFNPLPPHGGRPNGRYYPYPKQHFNPLPPHGGRPLGHEAYSCDIQISIHSLRMEGDTTNPWFVSLPFTFQSTPSAWRETLDSYCCSSWYDISIHSLRMEGDTKAATCAVHG